MSFIIALDAECEAFQTALRFKRHVAHTPDINTNLLAPVELVTQDDCRQTVSKLDLCMHSPFFRNIFIENPDQDSIMLEQPVLGATLAQVLEVLQFQRVVLSSVEELASLLKAADMWVMQAVQNACLRVLGAVPLDVDAMCGEAESFKTLWEAVAAYDPYTNALRATLMDKVRRLVYEEPPFQAADILSLYSWAARTERLGDLKRVLFTAVLRAADDTMLSVENVAAARLLELERDEILELLVPLMHFSGISVHGSVLAHADNVVRTLVDWLAIHAPEDDATVELAFNAVVRNVHVLSPAALTGLRSAPVVRNSAAISQRLLDALLPESGAVPQRGIDVRGPIALWALDWGMASGRTDDGHLQSPVFKLSGIADSCFRLVLWPNGHGSSARGDGLFTIGLSACAHDDAQGYAIPHSLKLKWQVFDLSAMARDGGLVSAQDQTSVTWDGTGALMAVGVSARRSTLERIAFNGTLMVGVMVME